MAWRRIFISAAVGLGMLLVGGCSGDEAEIEAGVPVATTVRPPNDGQIRVSENGALIEFRPVIGMTAPASESGCGLQDLDGVLERENRPEGSIVIVDCEDGAPVVLYLLGPLAFSGHPIESVAARLGQNGQWVLDPVFNHGSNGIEGFNALASTCYSKSSDCPTGQLALVIDGEVIFAPTIEQPQFERDQIQISGTFTEQSADALVARISGT